MTIDGSFAPGEPEITTSPKTVHRGRETITPVRGVRLAMIGVGAVQSRQMREAWVMHVQGTPGLPVYAYKVASIIATYVNVDTGYAWVEDKQIGATLGIQKPNVKEESLRTEARRGIKALVLAGLIDLDTRFKKGKNSGVEGRSRRIYLSVPDVKVQSEGTAIYEGTIGAYEGTAVCANNLYTDPSDERKKVKDNTREGRGPDVPSPFTGDYAFVDAFDRTLVVMTGGKATDSIEQVVAEAFDATTASDPYFMPLDWRSVCLLRDSGKARDWFIARGRRMVTAKAA